VINTAASYSRGTGSILSLEAGISQTVLWFSQNFEVKYWELRGCIQKFPD
jgi:hypothetical protein